MNKVGKVTGQIIFYGVVAALIAYFSTSPTYRTFADNDALIKLSFAHGGKRKGECRRLSREELQKLAPNMRKPVSCPRERLPVFVKLEIDGAVRLENSYAPTGLSGDGPSNVYAKFNVTSGRHSLVVRMRDSKKAEGYDYSLRQTIDLAPRQNLAIQFRADRGKFVVE
jgi:hypothetical protein